MRIPAVLALVALGFSAPVVAQSPGALFPAAFVVEHGLIQTDADGSVFATEPVIDTYAGSWIVSERADGSRLVIDFARREITEIRTAEGRYSVMSFDRMAQLLRDLASLEGRELENQKTDAKAEPRLRVVEVEAGEASALKSTGNVLMDRQGLRHLRVLQDSSKREGGDALLDAWFDPEIRFGTRALDALENFEIEILGASADASAVLAPLSLAAARREAGGAFPILTVRAMVPGDAAAGTVEDVVRRLESIDAVPAGLVGVPDGFRRTPHPLELIVAHAEREAELDALMGGSGRRE